MSQGFGAVQQQALANARPLSAYLELTYACNWRCVFCYNPRHFDNQRLVGAEWSSVLDDLRALGVLTVTLTGGEPLLHPEFFEIAQGVRSRGFALKVFTNGSLVTREVAQRLAELRALAVEVSLHGASAEVHDATTQRPGSYSALWAAISHLQAAGARIVVKTPLTVMNEAELDAIIALTTQHAVPLRVDPSLTPRDDGDVTPLRYAAPPAAVERMMQRLMDRGIPPGATTRRQGGVNCGLGRVTLAIDPEGNVYPCMQWRKSALGNVRRQRLTELWPDSPVRQEAAQVARDANDMLVRLGGPASRFPYCPALAFQRTGSELRPDAVFLSSAAAADRLRTAARPLEVVNG